MSESIAGHEIALQNTGAPRGERNYWRVLLNGQSIYEGHNGAQARRTYRAVSEGLKRATQPAAGEPKPIGYISEAVHQELLNGKHVPANICTATPSRRNPHPGPDANWSVPIFAAPPAAAHGDEAVRKDAERLDFILTKCRKVVVEMLPRGRDVYVEEGVMGERTYPAVHHDKDWPAGSAEDFAVKRRAIDAAMRVQGDGGADHA